MFTRILFGTAFTRESLEAETEVADLAAALGASVIVLHAIEPIDPGGDQAPFQDFYASLQAAAEEKLAAVARRMSERRITCDIKVTIGPRWKEIVEQAVAESADLIVLGSRPRDEPLSAGSTSHKVFWTSEIPILFVRRHARPASPQT
jgi:nucleotide-binding universal stress UspA family protein